MFATFMIASQIHPSPPSTTVGAMDCNTTTPPALGNPANAWLFAAGLVLLVVACLAGGLLVRKHLDKHKDQRYYGIDEDEF